MVGVTNIGVIWRWRTIPSDGMQDRRSVYDIIWMKPDHESSLSVLLCDSLQPNCSMFHYGIVALSNSETMARALVASWDRPTVTTQWLAEADINRRFKVLANEAHSRLSIKQRYEVKRRLERLHKEGEKGGGKQPPESAVPKTTSGENAGESPTSEELSALENYNLGHHHYTLDLSAGNVESVRFVKILQGLLLELPFKRLREQFQTVYLLQKHLGVGSARTEKMLSERFGKHSRAYASTPNTQIQRSGFRKRQEHYDVVTILLCEMLYTLNIFYEGPKRDINDILSGGERYWDEILSELSRFNQRATDSQAMDRAKTILLKYKHSWLNPGGTIFLKSDCVEDVNFARQTELDKKLHYLR